MTRFSVNVGLLFAELPFLERFAAARRAGFEAVEFAWPRVELDDVVSAVRESGLRVAQMNMDAGDLAAGERGWACHPDAVDRWRRAFEDALELADRLDCRLVNVLAGNSPEGVTREELVSTFHDNLRWALPRAARAGRVLLLEVLNTTDTPAYLFTDTASAAEFIGQVGDPALRLQFDTYHVAMGGEDPAARLRDLAPLVGHVQVADAPGRHEPGTGAIDFGGFFAALADMDYAGAVGLEYLPTDGDTVASLDWLPHDERGWSADHWAPDSRT